MTSFLVDFFYPEGVETKVLTRNVTCVPRVGDICDFLYTDKGPASILYVKKVVWKYNDWSTGRVEVWLDKEFSL